MTTMELASAFASGKITEAEFKAQLGVGSGGSKKTTVTLTEFKGNKILEFKGNFKPFSLGKGKLAPIMEMAAEVQKFLKEQAV